MLIYEPAGRAREFASLACNIYRGCGHGCVYCYAPSATRRDRSDFNIGKERPGFIKSLESEASQWGGAKDQVLLSFTCDPFQPLDATKHIACQAIQVLHRHGFPVAVLTKGGSRALEALPLFGPQDAFASTLTFTNLADSLKWEPYAATPRDRIATLIAFHDAGIPTWASLEPCIDPEQSLELIRLTHKFVSLYKVGRLNYHPLGATTDWAAYTAAAVHLVTDLGRDYIVKDDLAHFVPRGFPQTNVK